MSFYIIIICDRCGHCKEFDPVYKKVAKKMLKNNENIVFGKMDGTANDIPYMFPPIKVGIDSKEFQKHFLFAGLPRSVFHISI